jgi:hypothetical protein
VVSKAPSKRRKPNIYTESQVKCITPRETSQADPCKALRRSPHERITPRKSYRGRTTPGAPGPPYRQTAELNSSPLTAHPQSRNQYSTDVSPCPYKQYRKHLTPRMAPLFQSRVPQRFLRVICQLGSELLSTHFW